MVGTSWSSSSSSCTSSFGSLDDDDVIKPDSVPAAGAPAVVEGRSVKFLCSYGGTIVPRHTDGTLRYVGGDNRVLSVHRPLRFYELQWKLRELCGWDVYLRCQLPTEDLDALISVTCDDDLANLVQVYDEAGKDKIRAFLFPRTTAPAPPPKASRPAAAQAPHQSLRRHSLLGEERPRPHHRPYLAQNGRHRQYLCY